MPEPTQKTQMKMLWDEHNLYIAAILYEEHLWSTLTRRDAIIYRDNDFEIFLDPDGDGLNYYELEINVFGTVMDLFMNKPYRKGGKADLKWDFDGLETAVYYKGTINDPSDTDLYWQVECAIPWSSLSSNQGISPKVGDEWRINFSRVQWDLEIVENKYIKLKRPEHNWVWSPQGKIDMHIPEQWGYLKFID